MPFIENILAREVLDSRGNPTVEATVYTKSGICASSIAPSGASTGKWEALELRDNDHNYFFGKGVKKAVNNIEKKIKESLLNIAVFEQKTIDNIINEIDGTNNKSNLGANATIAVSCACAKAAAKYLSLPLYRYLGGINTYVLPTPMMNILNGGAHANNNLDIQEFMIIPNFKNSFLMNLQNSSKVINTLKNKLINLNLTTAVGDEGGFAPNLNSNEQAIELIIESIITSGFQPGKDFLIALDIASSEIYDSNTKKYIFEKKAKSTQEIIYFYDNLVNKYPIISIEDPLDENDWEGWRDLTTALGKKIQIVGDDLFVTNVAKIKKGIKNHCANTVLIKINQIGTLSETFEAIELAKKNKYNTIISHRSGESEDTIIADIALATNSGQIKTGSLCRSDRVAKYNRLLRIEESEITKYKGIDSLYNVLLT